MEVGMLQNSIQNLKIKLKDMMIQFLIIWQVIEPFDELRVTGSVCHTEFMTAAK